MTDDVRRLLKTLTVPELKSVAEKHGVDTSSCNNKKSYISAIGGAGITEEQVKTALGAAADGKTKEAQEMEEIDRDLREISERPSEPMEVPEDENVSIERSIDQALLLRPLFFEVDTATEQAWNRMILGDFPQALTLNRDSRSLMIDRLSTFHLYSTALSVRAAETLLRQMKGLDGRMSSGIKTALAEAKEAFMNGPPKRRETTLERLESITTKALEAYLGRSAEAEEELRKQLQEYASFGARVDGARELLEIAGQAKRAFDIEQYVGLLSQSKAQAETAKGSRMKEMDSSFDHVRTAIEAAKEAGVDTTDGEARFKDARKAFKDSDFLKAMQLLASIEQAVDSAHLKVVREDRDAEAKEIAQITSSIQEAEPDLEEAAMYGMDVNEGLLFVKSTKAALQHQDVVTAAKYSRRVRKLTKSMEKDLRKLRKEREGAKSTPGNPPSDKGTPRSAKEVEVAKNLDSADAIGRGTTGKAPAPSKKQKKWKGLLKK
jgi:hypothetical protein